MHRMGYQSNREMWVLPKGWVAFPLAELEGGIPRGQRGKSYSTELERGDMPGVRGGGPVARRSCS